MKNKILSLLMGLLLVAALLPATVQTAWASDYDYIHSYQVDVTPNTNDGSLSILVSFQWQALEDLPATNSQQGGVKIGIPNGSIRELTALSGDIADIQNDNSYVYIDFTHDFRAGEVFSFSYSWVQEYMYTLDGSTVRYEYTPGWFDSIRVGSMTLTWHDPAGVTGTASDGDTSDGVHVLSDYDLDYGEKLSLAVTYASWPTTLDSQYSKDNLPNDYYNDYDYDDHSSVSDIFASIIAIFVVIVVISVFVAVIGSIGRYAGGFGTRYVFVNGLWYPRGPGGKPRPGSVGTKTRPRPPQSSSKRGGGFGGGSRGGGFGGGGFSGGSHCACASSCACACACACAGGGRAGCSAKNLYGAIHLDKDSSEKLS